MVSLVAVTVLVGCGGSTTTIIQNHTTTVPATSSASTTSTTTSTTTRAAVPQHIYFYALFGAEAQPEERPGRIVFAGDGTNFITRLHWQGWGGPIAVATGIDHSDNCTPNCIGGHFQSIPGQVTLYRPGPHLGRHMYLCYRLAFLARSPVPGYGYCNKADPPVPANSVTKCGSNTFFCPVEVDCPVTSAGTPAEGGCYGAVGVTAYVATPHPGPDRTGLRLTCPWSLPHRTPDRRAFAYICDPGR